MSGNLIYFSDFFKIEPKIIEEYGAFNISLLNDLPLFIDPFLIFCSDKPEYQKLHEDIIKYLSFLRDKASEFPEPDLAMLKAWYMFPEVKQTYLGFCENGNGGSGLGRDFAIALHTGLKDIFKDFGNEKITRSPHIEKVCLIKAGVGRDNISDFVTNLIKEYLLEYIQTFVKEYLDPALCKQVTVPKVKFDYKIGVWKSGQYFLPFFNGDFVLLTPRDILVRVETWINKEDMLSSFEQVIISLEDAVLRFHVNQYFYSQLSEKPKKEEKEQAAHKTIIQFPQLIDYYIQAKENSQEGAIKNSEGEVGDVKQVFVEQLIELVEILRQQTDFYKKRPNTYEEAMQRVLHLKHVIENGDGYRLFYVKGKPITRESDLHILYKLACYDTYSDTNSEVNNGRGPVDFKHSNGNKDKTIVEFKLTRTLKKNLEKQVEVYKAANRTDKAIKVILFFTEDEHKKTLQILNELELTDKPGIILIDARNDNKPSASIA